MNVMFISQCSKNALTQTRRLLDQFAERRGERSWQTPITLDGLRTVHAMLRKTARKNTAVACLWIRGKDHSELVWIVGDGRRFNDQGGTPTNYTERNVLRLDDENDWHHGEDIRLLACMAALFHDFGKANRAFQKKLRARKPIADAYRHEWVSLRLFEVFVGKDDDPGWLARLVDLQDGDKTGYWDRPRRDGVDGENLAGPMKTLPPLAMAVGWLILTHHRLPANPERSAGIKPKTLQGLPANLREDWCGSKKGSEQEAKADCWKFDHDTPLHSHHWRQHASRLAKAMLARVGRQQTRWLDNPYVMHLSRLALMLADHFYSGQPSQARYGDPQYPLIANTDRKTGAPKQRLDEHLIGVEVNASRLVRSLPRLAGHLPSIARHKGFRQRSRDTDFRWQDSAFDLASGLQRRSSRHGFFGVNMASTGCGKTLANGRILYALADPRRGARFTIALGLRSLTLQTGDAYRQRLGLGAEDMAVLVGGGAIRQLHEQQTGLARFGSESADPLLVEQDHVHFEGSLEDGPLKHWLGESPRVQKLLDAPVLICTIDHLMPATEGTRGGQQIAPMLRLLSSDLVLDEPDDFGLEDLPALSRLVNWAGLLGGRVLLSSATLPPALLQGLFQAYLEGRRHYQQNRGEPGRAVEVCCAWFDEYQSVGGNHADGDGFRQAHDAFVDKRLQRLAAAQQRRRALIQPLEIPAGQSRASICRALAARVREQAQGLHTAHHEKDPQTGKCLSVGLLRMANINPLVEVARSLSELGAGPGFRFHLCVYHSHHPLLVRSSIEGQLDSLLQRSQPEKIFAHSAIRSRLDTHPEPNQVFVVLATAVAEVGRDHDYDWAIVEPSSMRSIIQLAGRVRRHRGGACKTANIHLLETNVRYLEQGAPAFCRPGFESEGFALDHHRLGDLITPQQLANIDAASRIRERPELSPRSNLADLEHACLRGLLLGDGPERRSPVEWWWTTQATLSGELQRRYRFRNDPLGLVRYALIPDEDGKIDFQRFERDGVFTNVNNLRHEMPLELGAGVQFWGAPDYAAALEQLAEAMAMGATECARRFGVIDLPERGAEQGWNYHPALGFSRKA